MTLRAAMQVILSEAEGSALVVRILERGGREAAEMRSRT